MKFLKLFLILNVIFLNCVSWALKQTQPVLIYSRNETVFYSHLQKVFSDNNVTYQPTKTINTHSDNLYILFNVEDINICDLPKNYIVYQMQDLNRYALTDDYEQKLLNAVAVWDYSKDNIQKYNNLLYHYAHLPLNYQYNDPVILPCLLPVETLQSYKNLLVYSNKENTDISSHLPTLFFYTLMHNPKIIVEAGVRGGESTRAFNEALKYSNAQIIGIDMEPNYKNAYSEVKNSTFVCIDDMQFLKYYAKSKFKNSKIDIVFIDTSHQFHHTMVELAIFTRLLANDGMLMFHDSNVTPLNNGTAYVRLNETHGTAHGNPRGVTEALKKFFKISFNEHAYCNFNFARNGSNWHMIHYPFCNGLTIVKKLN